MRKQISAYEGDNSQETQAKLQEIRVSLQEAEADLQQTEYEKLISDSETLLSSLYDEYSELLNMRLDNIDALMADMIAQINADAVDISETLSAKADEVGYTLSSSMQAIWDENTVKTNNVIELYGKDFINSQNTTNSALNTINVNLQNVISQLNSIAKTNVKSASVSSSANSKEANGNNKNTSKENAKKDTTKTGTKSIKVGGKIDATGAKIYDHKNDSTPERQLYRNNPIYKVLKTDGNWLQVRWHKLSKGVTGWFKKGDVKAYATGKKNFANNEVAWTQENGLEEYIVRPSDGAILTPIARKGSVLNAQASNNIWDMANSPAEFIKDNLNFGSTNVPNNSNIQSSCVQNFDKVVFNMPNVKNYGELLSEMQRDPKFEKLILAMTFDQVAGKSKLGKGKSIR